jgi:hypothetical protein
VRRSGDRDESLTLRRWHEAQVRIVANGADEKTLAKIQAHYERARGLVDLRSSRTPNPVALDAGSSTVPAEGVSEP